LVKLVIIGAGQRGSNYAEYAIEHPELCQASPPPPVASPLLAWPPHICCVAQVVALAEPREARRREMAKRHGVPDELAFESWEQFKTLPKLADAVVLELLLPLLPLFELLRRCCICSCTVSHHAERPSSRPPGDSHARFDAQGARDTLCPTVRQGWKS